MFAIFILSLYSLYLIPYTLYKLCGGGSADDKVTKTWSSKKGGVPVWERVRSLASNPLVIQWAVYIALFWCIIAHPFTNGRYTSSRASAVQHFDPFVILELPLTATESDIKKAYRRLSLLYHPDKNPDPSSADYFANYIAKAYQALTDETSRENYQKYGHPDGPQAFSVSVALPEWFFSKDKNTAPIILLVLLFGGIVLPLAVAAWYLTRSNKFTGPNQLMHETIMLYAQDPRYGIKESQSLARIPETLVCAMEFILMPNATGQNAALDGLRRRILFLYPDLKDKAAMWKRRPSVIKAHLLLLAHLEREPIPAALSKDAAFVLQKCPALLQEMVGISCVPRVQPGYGWLAPALGSVEMMQHLVRAVPLQARKPGSKGGEGTALLLQLPEFDADVVRRLAKKKVKTLAELRALEPAARGAALRDAGVSGEPALDSVETALAALPTLWVRAELSDEAGEAVDPESVVLAGEVLTLRLRLALTRAAHAAPGFDPASIRGSASLAYAPQYPFPKEEVWYFVLGDGANGAMCLTRAALVAAEGAGARAVAAEQALGRDGLAVDPLEPHEAPAAGAEAPVPDAPARPEAQEVVMAFRAPLRPGRHVLTLSCLPDSWLGCDRSLVLKLKVAEATRAEREGRAARLAAAVAAEDAEGSWEEVGASDAEDRSDSDSEREEEGGEYDSDEYGTEESDEEEEGEGLPSGGESDAAAKSKDI